MSSLIGVPAVGFLLALFAIAVVPNPETSIQYVLASTALGGDEQGDHLVEAAIGNFILIIVLFFATVFVERRWVARSCPETNPRDLSRWIWLANFASYAPLFVFGAVQIAKA